MSKINSYDAIIIGGGHNGLTAAAYLSKAGKKTLVLERGRMLKHIEDYTTMNDDHWDYEVGDRITQQIRKRQLKPRKQQQQITKQSTNINNNNQKISLGEYQLLGLEKEKKMIYKQQLIH